MTNSAVLLDRGIRCLNNELGILDAERFVALILRETFDYTEWRKNNLFVGMSIDEIIDEADRYCKENAKSATPQRSVKRVPLRKRVKVTA
ncbi:MAG: hypothetical protein FWG79_02190 [Bacteroidales bacterium]|nr:hypothetical protein [Bacteroidales bacterium]